MGNNTLQRLFGVKMEDKKEVKIPDEVAKHIFDDMDNLVKEANRTLPHMIAKAICDTERKKIEKEFKGLI